MRKHKTAAERKALNDERSMRFAAKMERIYAEEVPKFERAVERLCAWKTCVMLYDPASKTNLGGFGDPFCGCENLPGWRARHPEGRSKPSVPVKATGRHGGRVQRSKRRKDDWKAWLTEMNRELDHPKFRDPTPEELEQIREAAKAAPVKYIRAAVHA